VYTGFFGLDEPPFRLTPDPRFFYQGGTHKRALSYLVYGLSRREGFVVVTGEIGAGKTVLVDHLLAAGLATDLLPARLTSTRLGPEDVVYAAVGAFGLGDGPGGRTAALERLRAAIGGRAPVLIVDEAQALSPDALEELRLLAEACRDGTAGLQVVLLGQPALRDLLAGHAMEQLRQRVVAAAHLGALSREETRAYAEHRLRRAGWRDDPRIAPELFDVVHAEAGGVPRRINALFDRVLLAGYLEEQHDLSGGLARAVADEMRREGLLAPLAYAGT
jgi:type II secretory pathway predicted ATPase ExeA